MKIIVDKQGKDAIMQLLDIAPKQGGLQNFNAVNVIKNSIEDYKEEKKEEKPLNK